MNPSARILLLAVVCAWVYQSNSTLRAQSSTLKQCSETLQKAIRATEGNRAPGQPDFGLLFGPIDQQRQQMYYDWSRCVRGNRIPITQLKTMQGEAYDVGSLTGKILVINFWFISCAPCRSEFPALNRLVAEYKGKNVLFLGLTPDRIDRLTPAFFRQNRFDFNIVPDAQSLANAFYISGYPTTYVVDQQGVIQHAWLGAANPYQRAKVAIDSLLKRERK